jgi:hypothetical protein
MKKCHKLSNNAWKGVANVTPYVASDETGNQPSQIEKTSININPNQKSGIE